MSRIQKERDRLLAATARTVGLTASATALVCLSIPGTLPLPLYLASLVLLACLAYAQFQLGTLLRSTLWMCVIVVAGSAIVLVNLLPMEPLGPSALSVVGVVGAVGIACLSVLSVTSRARLLVLVAAAAVTLAATLTTLIATHSRLAEPVLLIV